MLGLPVPSQAPVLPRAPVNPLDKATVVSVYPKDVFDTKFTMFPGTFRIFAADWQIKDDFSILTIGPSSWFKELEEGQPFLEIPVSSLMVADSFIKDYCNGLLACNMADKMPGLFYLPGALSKKFIAENYKADLESARARQKNYMLEYVRIADILWARTQGNPLGISNDARLFAEILGMKDKAWMGDFKAAQLNNCPACGEMINMAYPVCKHCKAIVNKARAEEMKLVFADK